MVLLWIIILMKKLSLKEFTEKSVLVTFTKFKAYNCVSVSQFLKELCLDVSFGAKTIKFSHTSMFKLLLFMRLKKIRFQAKMAKYLRSHEQDALNLGFYRNEKGELIIPDQRTISHFVNHIIDSDAIDILNSITQLIEDTAIKFGIVFDVETIKIEKPKENNNTRTFENRKSAKLMELCRFAKKIIYPQISMDMHHNAKYKKNLLLDILVYLSKERTFAHDGLKRLETERNKKSPDSDTLLYHLKKYENIEILQRMFEKAFDISWKIAKSSQLFDKRNYDVAIDYTDWFYYGKRAPMVVRKKPEKGTTKCYRFATINIVESENRFTLLALPVGIFDSKVDIVDKLISYAKTKIRINKIYADRGFFSADIINLFKKHNLTFLMPATQNKRIAKMVKVLSAPSVIKDYEMTDGRVTFNLAIIDDGKGKKAFATNLNINENESGLANRLFNLYSKRWGIETSYRMKTEMRAKTTSKNYIIRLFYFLFSTLLYNLWILIDSIISRSLLGRVIAKHLVTEKGFATMLFALVGDDG